MLIHVLRLGPPIPTLVASTARLRAYQTRRPAIVLRPMRIIRLLRPSISINPRCQKPSRRVQGGITTDLGCRGYSYWASRRAGFAAMARSGRWSRRRAMPGARAEFTTDTAQRAAFCLTTTTVDWRRPATHFAADGTTVTSFALTVSRRADRKCHPRRERWPSCHL